MGSYTQEFLDVTTTTRTTTTPPRESRVVAIVGASRPDNRVPIDDKIAELRRRLRLAGAAGTSGALYFPAGRYRIGAAPNNVIATFPFLASLVIPEGIELVMAPGAVLVPDRGCVIDLQGALDCGPVQVFDLSAGGLVVFGQRVDALRPEWWGTGTPALDTAAVQAALDAAIHNRRSYFGSVRFDIRPVLPIVLVGRYVINRRLVVDAGRWSDVLDAMHPGLRVPTGQSQPPRLLWARDKITVTISI